MQTVLVAGGAGFIGSHLCKELLSRKYKVVCIDNLITGSKNNIEHLLSDPNFSFVQEDITKPQYISSLDQIDFIFHLASPASPNAKSIRSYINFPLETMEVNSVGTRVLLELAKKNNAKFLYVSTSEVYGNPTVSPQNEEYFGNVNPNGVRSVYDEAKRFGEALTFAYLRKLNLDVRIIRIFNTYGSQMQKDDGRVVSNFINQAINNQPITIYGKGVQTRSFCYVDDMVEGIIRAMIKEGTKGEVINLGNPDERTVKDLAEIIIRLTGSQSGIVYEDLPEDDPQQRKPDITKAKNLLEWNPSVTIEEGLTKTIEYFKSV